MDAEAQLVKTKPDQAGAGSARSMYTIYCGGGNEQLVETAVAHSIPRDLYGSCFHPVRQLRKKFHGVWTDRMESLIPGYVFFTADGERSTDFYYQIRRLPMLTKLLGKTEDAGRQEEVAFLPLGAEEREWILHLVGERLTDGALPVRASLIGFDENDKVRVLDGPLKGLEGQIRRIRVHQRIAEVEVPFMGGIRTLHLGVELLGKK